ncbi:metallophosphoesterase [Candidatus Sumerlaeota bacterium]
MAAAQVETTTFVPHGAVWHYLDDGSDQGTSWTLPSFDDAGWTTGAAQLGYGDGDEATTIGFGPDPNNKFITSYFRHTFEATDASAYRQLMLRLVVDDGALVWLNGVELARTNLPIGAISASTTATLELADAAETGDEWNFYHSWEVVLSGRPLLEGANVLAVEVHQATLASPDLSFNLELVASTERMRKGPYLIYPDDNTQMAVLWQTDEVSTCSIEWGMDLAYGTSSTITTAYGADYQHAHMIDELDPGQLYFYRVSVRGDLYEGSFRAAPAADAHAVKLLAYGDTRTNMVAHDRVCSGIVDVFRSDPANQTLLLHVGDWSNAGGLEWSWSLEYFTRWWPNTREVQARLPIHGVRGNHELLPNVFLKYWPYPYVMPHYWSFDYGPAHIAIVDQYTDYTSGSAQLTWLEGDLAASDKPWKIMVFHEPGWSAGQYFGNPYVRTELQPLCEKYGVQLVFAGHNHNYARALVNGVQHITTGGGGGPLTQPAATDPNVVVVAVAFQFCQLEIEGNTLRFQALAPDGTVIDSFTIPSRNTTDVHRSAWELW